MPKGNMNKLLELGWNHRYDTFETYYKKIGDYEIIVSKHINSKTWDCVLVQYCEIDESCEITVNNNATLEWVISFTKLLLEAELS